MNSPSLVSEIIEGFGENFIGYEELFKMTAGEEKSRQLSQPLPSLGRYWRYVSFMKDITSQRAVSYLRFSVMLRYFLVLEKFLSKYKTGEKIVNLTPSEREKIESLLFRLSDDDIVRAEELEKVTDHDTAAAGDYLKLLIAKKFPELEDQIEGIHFAATSEDVMSIVFGAIGNQLIYNNLVGEIVGLCQDIIDYVDSFEGHKSALIPALTHLQAAEPSTLGKKFLTPVSAICGLLDKLVDKDGNFYRFTGVCSGAVGNFTTHHAAYPNLPWEEFGRDFVESFGLHWEPLHHQCSTYTQESFIFTTISNILMEIVKFINDFLFLASCRNQFFIKEKKPGSKGSSIMPNKSNAWKMEGAKEMLLKSKTLLLFLAERLVDYPQEGNMGRSWLLRDIGSDLAPAFIGIGRIREELSSYRLNLEEISDFFRKYPGMAGSCGQVLLKKHHVMGDAYRIIQQAAINPDGSYTNLTQYQARLKELLHQKGVQNEIIEQVLSYTNFEVLTSPVQRIVQKEKNQIKQSLKFLKSCSSRTGFL